MLLSTEGAEMGSQTDLAMECSEVVGRVAKREMAMWKVLWIRERADMWNSRPKITFKRNELRGTIIKHQKKVMKRLWLKDTG
jgi:hypothetical protein